MPEILLGTSGWSYGEWVGVFYPSTKTKKLAYYAGVFRTVEIDSTFYAYPREGVVRGWEKNVPPGFVFSAKIPKLITHDKGLDTEKGAISDLYRFLDVMKPLMRSGKLGPLLVQLPPSFSFERGYGKLKSFLEAAPSDVMLAVEFRHLSWLKEETSSLLRSHGVANTVVDEPLLPPDADVTAEFAMVRWHGRGSKPWYNYRYSDEELSDWKPRLDEISRKVRKVYGYFNNHFHGFAVENVLKTLEMVGGASTEQEDLLGRVSRSLQGGEEPRLLDFVAGDGSRPGGRPQ